MSREGAKGAKLSLFLDLQLRIKAMLDEDDYFREPPIVPVVVEALGEVGSEIDQRVARTSHSVVIFVPRVRPGPGVREKVVSLALEVREQTPVNRGGRERQLDKNCWNTIEAALAILDETAPNGMWAPLLFDDLIDFSDHKNPNFNLIFETRTTTKKTE